MLEDWDIVIVGHNSLAQIKRAWAPAPESVRQRVAFIDNGSTDGTLKELSGLFGVEKQQDNRGLSAGNNFGARLGHAKYLIFCNPDVTMAEADLLLMEKHLDMYGGAVAPRLHGVDNVAQESARGWPTLVKQVRHRLGVHDQSYTWPLKVGSDARVPWLLGAVVAMTRADFELVNGWPEEYFLYYEDTELCMRLWDAGRPVWLLGSLSWTHEWARSSRSPFSKATRLHFRSAVRFFTNRPNLILTVPRRYVALLHRDLPGPESAFEEKSKQST